VLLYELLTGTTPFPEKRLRSVGDNEMQRIIMEEEPERSSTRLRQKSLQSSPSSPTTGHYPLSTDLDWIVMKCLEKDRSRRYETANGLAMDLQRHLNNEPVMARPPSRLYRLQKLVRRNKLVCTAAAAVAVAMLFGIIASTLEAARVRRAEQQQSRLRAEAETTLATSDFAEANRLIAAGDAADAVPYLSRILRADPGNRAALSQLVMVLTYHSWMVPALALGHAVFADGQRIVTASRDNTAQIWDVQTGLPLTGPMVYSNRVSFECFSPDGKLVVTASDD
jgi:hypothetical protein